MRSLSLFSPCASILCRLSSLSLFLFPFFLLLLSTRASVLCCLLFLYPFPPFRERHLTDVSAAGELILSDNSRIGVRQMVRYYKQKPKPGPSQALVIRTVIDQYKSVRVFVVVVVQHTADTICYMRLYCCPSQLGIYTRKSSLTSNAN